MDIHFITGHPGVSHAFVQMFGSNLGITYWLTFPVLINICYLLFQHRSGYTAACFNLSEYSPYEQTVNSYPELLDLPKKRK